MAEDAIKVFISYSWDSKEHKNKVYHLAQALRDDGIDCTIDQFVQSPDNWDRWMLDQIDKSNFVLIVCTERYYRRYRGQEEVNKGLGVTWESTLIMGKLYDSQGRNPKFYPIFFDAPNIAIIPYGLRTSYFDLSRYDLFNLDNNEQRLKEDGGYQDLYRLLTKQPYVTPRKIGSLKKLETVDRETEQQEVDAAERQRQQAIERQRGLEQQRLLEQQRQEGESVDRAIIESEEPLIKKRKIYQLPPELKAREYTSQLPEIAKTRYTRQQFLKWLLFGGGVTVAIGIGVRSLQRYSKLQHFLEAQQWKEANQETWNIVRQVAGESQGNLDPKSFKDFPCEVISDINKLWFQYSNGKFGFSVQREIWLEVGSPSGQEDISWDRFTDRVGWQGRHIDASGSPWVGQPIFSLQAPVGHLPIPPALSTQDYRGVITVGASWTNRWRELNAGIFSRCDMPVDATSTLFKTIDN